MDWIWVISRSNMATWLVPSHHLWRGCTPGTPLIRVAPNLFWIAMSRYARMIPTDLFCGGWSFKRQYDAQEAVLQLGMRLWACRSRDISLRSTQLHLAVRERNSSLEKQFWCCLLILLSVADSGCQSTVVLHSNKLSLKKKASFRGCCPRLSRWV